jgi:uncharacterized protein YcbX
MPRRAILKNHPITDMPMAILSEITLYPIKSCAGIAVRAATLTRAGLTVGPISDREWMLVDPQGLFLSQREHPRMALIVPRLSASGLSGPTLQVDAPGMAPLQIELEWPDVAARAMVQVWDDRVQAFDCGAASAAWFSMVLGTACRLVRFDPACGRHASAAWTGAVAAPTRFSDGFPLLLIGAASLQDLNQKLIAAGREALPMNRFRPNLVLDGIEAFDEDLAESFRLGPMLLKPVKPCARCTIPSLDQNTGQVGPDPLDLLRTYRIRGQARLNETHVQSSLAPQIELDDAICFGMNCIVVEGEREQITVGQQVEFELAFS